MKLLDEIKQRLGVHAWAYQTLWRVDFRYTLGLILCGFLAGLTPVLLFVSLRGLIDDQLRTQGANVSTWLVFLLVVGIVEAIVSLAHKLFRNLLRERAIVEVNEKILREALNRPVWYFEQNKSINHLEKIKSVSAERLVELVGRNSQIIACLVQIATISLMLASIEPLILLVIPPCFIPYLWYQLRLSSDSTKELQQRSQDRRQVSYFVGLMTSPHSVAETRLLGISGHLIDRFRQTLSLKFDTESKKNIRQFIGGSLFSVLCTAIFVALIWRMLNSKGEGQSSLGNIVFFAASSIRLRKSLEDLTHSLSAISDHLVYVSALKNFILVKKNDESIPIGQKAIPFLPEIRFENVSFQYNGQERHALSDITFTIAPGETIAIVGENGSGKSTLVKLIAGLMHPTTGNIYVSGVSIKDLDKDYLFQKIGFVFQDFGKYCTTLQNNVAYGNWQKYSDVAENRIGPMIEPKLIQAGLVRDIERMPQGVETVLGKHFGGYEPSGGVWQKIALARAFAREAPILILDEPSSAIDAKTEYELFRKIGKLSEGSTTILISHRFSTVSMASRIFVMDHGKLVEIGTHEELISKNGKYATLFDYHKRLHGEG